MGDRVTRELFSMLKQAIPELPDNVRKLTLELNVETLPIVTYECCVNMKDGRQFHVDRKTFQLEPFAKFVQSAVRQIAEIENNTIDAVQATR